MQLSQKSNEIIDACRFCWMCRHICPIGNATGQERNTARARALSLSLVKRGAAQLAGDIVDNVYECALCGGCTADCATGWDPVKFTKEARLSAALEGNMPAYVETLLQHIEETGNIYGESEVPAVLADAAKQYHKGGKVFFFLGEDATYRTPAMAAKALELLAHAKVDLSVDVNAPSSHYAMDFLIGAAEETRTAMQKTAAYLNGTGADTVVCYDPADARVFLREYKEYGIEITPRVVTFPAYLAALLQEGKLTPKKGTTPYTFQDPALLARELEDTTGARAVLAACGETREMLLNGKATMLAGSLLMNTYLPKVMAEVANRRVADALHVGAQVMVTASPAEYVLLSAAARDGLCVKTLEEVVLSCL